MKYWSAWLKSFGLKFEICLSRLCLTIIFIGFVANKREKRYCIWLALPKYSLIVTNENKYPYVPEIWYWKFGHVHLCHVIGSTLKDIPYKVELAKSLSEVSK